MSFVLKDWKKEIEKLSEDELRAKDEAIDELLGWDAFYQKQHTDLSSLVAVIKQERELRKIKEAIIDEQRKCHRN